MSQKLPFNGGLTCALECSNISNTIQWYQEILGFQLIYHLEEMGWCEMQSPVERVTLGLSQVETPQVKGGATLTFGVSNIDEARSQLEANDVPFDGETMTIPEMVRFATFYDPDGNKLMFYEDLSQNGQVSEA